MKDDFPRQMGFISTIKITLVIILRRSCGLNSPLKMIFTIEHLRGPPENIFIFFWKYLYFHRWEPPSEKAYANWGAVIKCAGPSMSRAVSYLSPNSLLLRSIPSMSPPLSTTAKLLLSLPPSDSTTERAAHGLGSGKSARFASLPFFVNPLGDDGGSVMTTTTRHLTQRQRQWLWWGHRRMAAAAIACRGAPWWIWRICEFGILRAMIRF